MAEQILTRNKYKSLVQENNPHYISTHHIK